MYTLLPYTTLFRSANIADTGEKRMTADEVPVLTIDRPSGSGKGTISRTVARRRVWHYLDSGELYRAVGVAAGWGDLDLGAATALVRCRYDTQCYSRDAQDGERRGLGHGPHPHPKT